jgi:hypothetical protein
MHLLSLILIYNYILAGYPNDATASTMQLKFLARNVFQFYIL